MSAFSCHFRRCQAVEQILKGFLGFQKEGLWEIILEILESMSPLKKRVHQGE